MAAHYILTLYDGKRLCIASDNPHAFLEFHLNIIRTCRLTNVCTLHSAMQRLQRVSPAVGCQHYAYSKFFVDVSNVNISQVNIVSMSLFVSLSDV